MNKLITDYLLKKYEKDIELKTYHIMGSSCYISYEIENKNKQHIISIWDIVDFLYN